MLAHCYSTHGWEAPLVSNFYYKFVCKKVFIKGDNLPVANMVRGPPKLGCSWLMNPSVVDRTMTLVALAGVSRSSSAVVPFLMAEKRLLHELTPFP